MKKLTLIFVSVILLILICCGFSSRDAASAIEDSAISLALKDNRQYDFIHWEDDIDSWFASSNAIPEKITYLVDELSKSIDEQ